MVKRKLLNEYFAANFSSSVTLILAQLYLLFFPFGQIFRFSFFRPEIHIYPQDFIVALIALLFLIFLTFQIINKQLFPSFLLRNLLTHPLFWFMLVSFLSLLTNPLHLPVPQLISSSLYWFRLFAYLLFYLGFRYALKIQPSACLSLLHCLALASVIFIVSGFLQLFLFPNLYYLQTFGWDPHYHRLVGTLLDPGFTGIIFVIIFLFFLSFQQSSLRGVEDDEAIPREHKPNPSTSFFTHHKHLHKYILWLIIFSSFVAIFFTYSRASYLALLVGTATISWIHKFPKVFLTVFTGLILAILTLPKPAGEGGNLARTSTISFRIINYRNALQVFSDHPLLGVGFNSYRYAQSQYDFISDYQTSISHSASGVDNSFIFVLTTTGLIGLGLFLSTIIKSFCKIAHPPSSRLPLAPCALAIFISVITHSQFQNTLFYPWVMGLLVIIFALTLSPLKDSTSP